MVPALDEPRDDVDPRCGSIVHNWPRVRRARGNDSRLGTIPLRMRRIPPAPRRRCNARLRKRRTMRALIADDDRVTSAMLARTLERWHLEVVQVHDGVAAWDLLSTGNGPSLAIVDWMMPGLDGLELCRRIRTHETLVTMHVILLTSRDGHADVVAGLEAGADDYIVKPFDVDELHARVHVGVRIVTLQERLAAQVTELKVARDELSRLASTDALTDLCSRRQWLGLAANEFERYRRYRRPFSVLMADLDLFKRVNDTFGHGVGDEVLKRFADVLRLQCRTSDFAGRVGGEEFAVLLPETACPMAQDVARRIVESCRALAVSTPGGVVTFTCSIGVASATPGDETLESIIERADSILYRAKKNGRDRVEVESSGLADVSRLAS
jgi:two-component system cell cycle response regulator